jgi:hypothetical protein
MNGEKQHRELWPAYNPNIAPPQASTEGLFQQTRLISTIDQKRQTTVTAPYRFPAIAASRTSLWLPSGWESEANIFAREVRQITPATSAESEELRLITLRW